MNLSGPRLKLARANKHIRDLESIFETFICDNPYRLEIEEYADGNGINIRAVFDRKIPFETSAIIGDAIHNIRSALDHLAAIAVVNNGGTITNLTSFPIYKNKSDLTREAPQKLRGASADFINFVINLNPTFNATDNRIYLLSKLNNFDKHNALIPAVGIFKVTNIIVTDSYGSPRLTIRELNVRGGKINNLASIGGTGLQFKADSDATVKVVFDNTDLVDGEIIVDILKRIHDDISKVVNSAEAVLASK